MRVGLAAYSMRTFLEAKPGTARAMDLLGFIDWAATLDTDAVELTSYYFPEKVTREFLLLVSPLPLEDAPSPRVDASGVWTGQFWVIWGGTRAINQGGAELDTGARFDPERGIWRPLPIEGAPTARTGHTAVFTPGGMLIWGGTTGEATLGNGGLYRL